MIGAKDRRMPHRPESELAGAHSQVVHEMLRPVEAPILSTPQNYQAPFGAFDASAWERECPPNRDGTYAPAACHQYLTNHHFDSNQEEAHEIRNERVKRLKSDNEDEAVDNGAAKKDDRESPASAREAFSVTSESSTGSPFVSGWDSNKKRKKHLDVLRRNRCWLPTQRGDAPSERLPSPVSSVESLHNDIQSEVAASTTPTAHPSRSECCDQRYEAPSISPQAVQSETSQHPAVSNFPNVLHIVLSQLDGDCSVLQWLQTGDAWRVVRWDALRRVVMPKYFPELCQEEDDGSNGGSIDAFLWNVRAWGFVEVKDGPDAGAYAHPVSAVWVC